MSNNTLDLKSEKSDMDLLSQTMKSTIEQALVKKFIHGNERPCDKNDFLETKDDLEKSTADLMRMVENLTNDHFSKKNNEESEVNPHCKNIDNELLTLLLILCGQNNSTQPWNTKATTENCEVIFSQILKLLNCKDSSDLFLRNSRTNVVKNILQRLCSDLTPSTWKQYPASVVCYNWILKMINQPELSQYLGLILPPALLLTDDFVVENRIIGVECLSHIINNITIAELQLYGHGEVIFSALIPVLRTREAVLIQHTIVPLVSLTAKLEFDLGKKDPTKWSRFDNILEIYLESMELEQIVDLRNCYIKNLTILISNVGHNIVRWSKRLLRIFDEYVQTAGKYNDESTMCHSVKAIEKFMELSEGAVFLYAKHLLVTLQMALYSTINYNSGTGSENLKSILGCIKKFLEILTEVEKDEFKKDFINQFSSDVKFKTFYNQMHEILKCS